MGERRASLSILQRTLANPRLTRALRRTASELCGGEGGEFEER
jgi:hypothetical protein